METVGYKESNYKAFAAFTKTKKKKNKNKNKNQPTKKTYDSFL